MDLTLSIISIVFVICFYIYYSTWKKKSNLPGPNGYPIIANTFDVDFKEIHIKLFQWGKIYGDIFQVIFFGKTFVIVNSSNVLRELFVNEPNATLTSARSDTFFKNYMLSDVDVVFTSLDKKWTQRRKLVYKLIHSYGEGMHQLETEMTKKLLELRKELSEGNQEIYNPEVLVDDFVMSILEILILGKSHGRNSAFHRYFIEIDKAGNAVGNPGVDTLYNNLPFLRFLPLPSTKLYRRFITLRDGLLEFLDKQTEIGYSGVFTSMKNLLSEKSKDDSDSWFNEKIMESMLTNIIGAGFLTTKATLLSLIQILMSLPKVQIKLQEEVDRVIGHDRHPCLSDRQAMPFHEAVILETLRFSSHTPLAIPHSASEDVKFREYLIPKGSVILSNLWAIHHSDMEWKDPFEFVPERFLDENGEIFPADHEIRKRFVGFGIGKRSCIGESFAKSRIFLFLSILMQENTVLPPSDDKPKLLNPRKMTPGITMMPNPFTCRFIKRKY